MLSVLVLCLRHQYASSWGDIILELCHSFTVNKQQGQYVTCTHPKPVQVTKTKIYMYKYIYKIMLPIMLTFLWIYYPFFFIGTTESARMATVSVITFSFLLATGMLIKISDADVLFFSADVSVQSFGSLQWLMLHCIELFCAILQNTSHWIDHSVQYPYVHVTPTISIYILFIYKLCLYSYTVIF